MTTVPQPRTNAKYALVDGEPAILAKVADTLWVVRDDCIERFTAQMALGTVLLGDLALADDQAMRDRIAGGAARIACNRVQEVA